MQLKQPSYQTTCIFGTQHKFFKSCQAAETTKQPNYRRVGCIRPNATQQDHGQPSNSAGACYMSVSLVILKPRLYNPILPFTIEFLYKEYIIQAPDILF